MFSTLAFAFNAVAPLVCLIFLGFIFRRIGLFTEEFVSKGYSFCFRIALPALLFCNVYSIESVGKINFRSVLYTLLVVFATFAIGVALSLLLVKDRKRRGVVTQCFFRSNCAVLGLALTESLGGVSALQCVSVLTAFSIPLFNILAVISLTVFLEGEEERERGFSPRDLGRILYKIVTNPLIIGVCLGLLCLVFRSFIPTNDGGEKIFLLSRELPVLYTVVENISRIASPMMLLLLGAQFSFSAGKTMRREIAIGVIGRVLLSPVLAFGGAYLLNYLGVISVGSAEYASFFAIFASPVAVSSAIMAREMENDGDLAAQLVVYTSIASGFTIFLFSVFFRAVGLI